MPERDPTHVLTRRRFLGGMVTVVCGAPVLGLGCSSPSERPGLLVVDGWEVPAGAHLSAERYANLQALFDALIPGDSESPGAALAKAARYMDCLLGAFDTDPPRIYAGGPYSGRHGGVDGFAELQRLTRVEELRWRTAIEGSLGLAEREFNGPVVGLKEQYERGLDALDEAAREAGAHSFASLGLAGRRALLLAADPQFRELAYGHAVEGTYGDPVYGGNAQMLGWTAIDYEGDRQPTGYSARQMAHPEDG